MRFKNVFYGVSGFVLFFSCASRKSSNDGEIQQTAPNSNPKIDFAGEPIGVINCGWVDQAGIKVTTRRPISGLNPDPKNPKNPQNIMPFSKLPFSPGGLANIKQFRGQYVCYMVDYTTGQVEDYLIAIVDNSLVEKEVCGILQPPPGWLIKGDTSGSSSNGTFLDNELLLQKLADTNVCVLKHDYRHEQVATQLVTQFRNNYGEENKPVNLEIETRIIDVWPKK